MTLHPELISGTINTVFNCCPTVIKNEILDHIKVVEVPEDRIFIKTGEPCDGVYIIIKGGVKLFLNKENKKSIFLFKAANDIIGLKCLMTGVNYDYSAAAMEDLVLGFIPKAQIEKIITMYPQAFYSLFKKVNDNANEMELRSSMIMTDSAEKIIMHSIEDLKNRFGTDDDGYVKVYISAKDLASYTCMSKTNLYRILQTLKEKNILNHHLSRYRIESGRI